MCVCVCVCAVGVVECMRTLYDRLVHSEGRVFVHNIDAMYPKRVRGTKACGLYTMFHVSVSQPADTGAATQQRTALCGSSIFSNTL